MQWRDLGLYSNSFSGTLPDMWSSSLLNVSTIFPGRLVNLAKHWFVHAYNALRSQVLATLGAQSFPCMS